MEGWRWEWCETLRGIIPPQPDTCRVFLASVTGRAMPAPCGLCQVSSQKLLWESKVCGQRLDGAGERISRSGALSTISPWGFPKKDRRPGKRAFEGFLQNSYRPWAFFEPYKWDGITSDQGLRVSLTAVDLQHTCPPLPPSFARRQKKISIPKKALLGPAAF